MTTRRHSQIFQQLRQAVLAHDGAGLTDADLMSRFVAQRDGAALEALIRRHGSMVWSVCRRVLSNEQDAEDAFQASFLVFVRKAASIRGRAQVGNWLYGVAYRTALKARTTEARRRAKERRAVERAYPQTETDSDWSDLLAVLDQELNRLPDKYRAAIVLCELEGRPRKEAARQLGIPEGTLSSRLATGRRMLAKRFGRPDLALSAGALATASVAPPALLASTVKAITLVAAGQAAVAGVVSVRVAALAEGVLKAMLLTRISAGVVLLAVVAVLAAGAGTAVYSEQAAPPDPKPLKPPVAVVQPEKNKEDKKDVKKEDPEWGEAVDGVQVRLRIAKPASGSGEFAVDVRSQGQKDFKQRRSLDYCDIMMDGQWYAIHGAGEEESQVFHLRPGKQIDSWVKASLDGPWVHRFALARDGSTPYGVDTKPLQVEPGKHTLRIGVSFDQGPTPKSQPVEIVIGKESTWGKAVDGVQARIRVRKAVWGPNETPAFHLDLRNQGKQKPHAMRNPYAGEIEADGAWYHYSGPVEIKAQDMAVEPGKQIDDWVTVTPDELWLNESHKAPIDPKDYLSLKPGKHTLRIAVTLAGEKWIRPISGPIEIEVREKSPADKRPDAVTAPTKVSTLPGNANDSPARRALDIRKKLNETIKYELPIDTTLDKALDELLTRNGVPWWVNTHAFVKQGNRASVIPGAPIEKINEVEGVTRGRILELLLSKIELNRKGQAMAVVRPEGVEITTLQAYRDEFFPGRKDGYLPPLVYADFDKVPLSEALAELKRMTGMQVITAGYVGKEGETKVTAELTGVPLDAAVTVLADMAELKCVRVGNIYYVTTPERAHQLEADEQNPLLKEKKQPSDAPPSSPAVKE